ncbi:MAG: apolipoprotein N-acyltransferase [Actinomycetota bacterium]|nr:apolipoprotein N-acyltransferase [Actinomycetota bacterium]
MDLVAAAPDSGAASGHPPGTAAPHARAALVVAPAAGLVLVLAFPPFGWWWLAPFCVAGLAWSCRSRSLPRGALLGGLGGLGFFLPLLHWSGAVAGTAAWLALALLEAAFFALLGAALALTAELRAAPVWVACLWVAEEALRSRLPFGGFPWGRLAFAGGDNALLPLASLAGAPLVTFATALIGGVLLLLAQRTRMPRRALVAWVVLAGGIGLASRLVPLPASGPPVTVAVIQGSVPRLGLAFNAQRAAVLDRHVRQTHALAVQVRAGRLPAPDLVIWPENSSDIDPLLDRAAGEAISAAAADIGVPVLVGAVLDGPGRYVRNAGIVWDPVAGPGAMYVKRHPVPFGEYLPFRALVDALTSKAELIPRDFLAGHGAGVLSVGRTARGPVVVGDVICFEIAYDGLVRDVVRGGGKLLVVQTNNATFGRSGESSQQLAMGRLRSVETGRAVLVAATSGISAVIAPDGTVLGRSAFQEPDLLVRRLPLRSSLTPAMQAGAWPEVALALASAAACGVAVRGVHR